MKVLLTSTSFQDTPGKHHELLNQQNWEIDTLRGPLKEEVLLPIIQNYDAIICGDDEITEKVIRKGKSGNLKAISKYGIGLDKIDLNAAKNYGIPVTNTPGVNHIAVAEHTLALIFAYYKNLYQAFTITKNAEWKRPIGHEIYGKKILIIGLGRIGKELAIRAKALGLIVYVNDVFFDKNFIQDNNFIFIDNIKKIIPTLDIISVNCPLTDKTENMLNINLLENCDPKLVIVNTARAKIVNQSDLLWMLEHNKISAYLTDVLDEEPINKNNPLLKFDNVFITPHIGSRTFQSVERQGTLAVENLVSLL